MEWMEWTGMDGRNGMEWMEWTIWTERGTSSRDLLACSTSNTRSLMSTEPL